MVEFNWSSKCSKLRSKGPVIRCGYHDTLKNNGSGLINAARGLHISLHWLKKKKKKAHLPFLDSVNVSNSELKAPRVSAVIFCSETPLGLRKQVLNRNPKLMEKVLPCGSEEAKLALSGF